jgi:class 3 adenylate cyclase/tetratricopeptide (TPR) repeat protein
VTIAGAPAAAGQRISRSEALRPYVARLLQEWLISDPDETTRELDGTFAYVDISGFTSLTERLARRGRIGAEELSDILHECFTRLLQDAAFAYGGQLVKWGGDALYLLFEGPEHARRAARAVCEMRAELRAMGRIRTSAGFARLGMSAGLATGRVLFVLAGDVHQELVVTGETACVTAIMETTAAKGEIVLAPSTAEQLDPANVGAARGDGMLLRGKPDAAEGRLPLFDLPLELDLEPHIPLGLPDYLLEADHHEHRNVAVAFIDYSGIRDVLARDGEAELIAALRSLIEVVEAECTRNEVTFWETDVGADGGKIMLVAGAPRSTGSDDERILRTVQASLSVPSRLVLRAGVNRGHVFAGQVGPPTRRTASVKGDAVNLAARLSSRAAAGQVLVTPAVLERSATRFDVEPLEPFSVKGKRMPIQAFELRAPASRDRDTEKPSLPLVGREQELQRLLDALAGARAGRGRVVELVAEPGIGKSRLVEALADRAEGFATVTVLGEEYTHSVPYAAVAGPLSSLLGLEGTRPNRRAARLRSLVAETAPGLEPWLPLVAIPLGLAVDSTPEVGWLDDRFRTEKIGESVVELLAAVETQPLLVLVEDAHLLDDASTELLTHVCGAAASRPWLVVVTRRPGPCGIAVEGLELESIELQPLDDHAARDLVELAAGAPLPPHVQAALTARAGGNPLFLTELALTSAETDDALPDTLESLLAAQIDRLGLRDRTVLRVAAVLGTTVDEDVLSAVLDGEVEGVPWGIWDRLAEFVTRTGPTELRFRHALIRDAAYEGLPYRRRTALHESAAAAIELRAGVRAEEHAAVLSLHYFHANRHDRASHFSLVAAARAQSVYANAEAAELLQRALIAGRRARAADYDMGEVAERLGDVRHRLGDYARAAEAFRIARALLPDDPVARATLLWKQARVSLRLKRYSDGLRALGRGLTLLRGVDGVDAARVRAQLTVRYAALLQEQGRSREAVRRCHEAIEVAGAAGELDALAHAYYLLDWAHFSLGEPEKARYSKHALRIYEDLGDLAGQAVVLNNLGAAAYEQGRWDEAIELYDRGREARLRTGDAVNAAYGTSNIAEILSDRGQLAEAEELLKEALRVWQASGYRFGEAFATSQLARAAARAGRDVEANELYSLARQELVDIGARSAVVETDARVAEAHLLAGRSRRALQVAQRVLAELGPDRGASVRPLLLRVRGSALAKTGRLGEATAALEEAVTAARALGADHELFLGLTALASVRNARGQETDEIEAEREGLGGRLRILEPRAS